MSAVEVRGGYKYYGHKSGPNQRIILNYINMTVTKGSIYGLLGASGCGKTTLLSCIVGQRHLNSGDIKVFGLKPGNPSNNLTGPRIGYMPQEIALVTEMTVKETIYYFGRIYDLSEEKIRDRYKLLDDLLELPPSKHLVRNCSGGQQRRISFACAMVHEPELLILDEPTVGLDPLLREKIWNFLTTTTKSSNLAVIITTHYIEEARQATCIGLMRNGILLAEDSPINILEKFECSSLEEAFLLLSQKQGQSEEPSVSNRITSQTNNLSTIPIDIITDNNISNNTDKLSTIATPSSSSVTKQNSTLEKSHNQYDKSSPSISAIKSIGNRLKETFSITSKRRMKALMTKNWVQLLRQPSGMLFIFLFPILQLSCFYLAVGNNPTNLRIGVVNYEVSDPNECLNNSLITVFPKEETCEFHKLSCRFLNGLDETIAYKIYYNSVEEAFDAAKKTQVVGFLHFAHNYSESMQRFLEDGQYTDEGTLDTRELNVRLDMSDQPIALFIERGLIDTYKSFIEGIMIDCNLSKDLAKLPVNFEEPIFGSFNEIYRNFIAPGIIMTMVFFLATLMTAAVFISERLDGVWDRTLISGISTAEMLIAHIFFQTVIMAIQCLEVILYVTIFFSPENKGDNFSVIALLILTGFAGTLFGLLISVYCKSHTMANFIATGAFYPMIILCGLVWPLEGMPTMLRKIALIFPFTVPSVSVRNILQKGWSITNSQVYNGFLIMFLWIILLLICCIIGLKRKT